MSETLVSLDVYNQVVKERDIAIQQLHELGYEFGQKIEPTTKDLSADWISRSDAIKAIQKYGVGCLDADDFSPEQSERFVINKLNELPSVTPRESRKGHWIYDYTSADGHKIYHCSECGCYLKPKHSELLSSYKWCSLCGADMREVDK